MPSYHTNWIRQPTSPVSLPISSSYFNNWQPTISRYQNFKSVTFCAVELVTCSRFKRPSIQILPHILTRQIRHFIIRSRTLLCIHQISLSLMAIWATRHPQPTLVHFNPMTFLQRSPHSSILIPSSPLWKQLQQLQLSRLHLGLHARPGLTVVANAANPKHPTHLQRIHHVPTATPMDTMLTQAPTAIKCDGVPSLKPSPTRRD